MITKYKSRQVKPGRSGLRSILSLMLIVILSASILTTAVPFEAQAAGGAYTLKWYAADPAVNKAPYLPTYAKLTPNQLACPGNAGRYADPLKDAVTYASPMSSSNLDAVTSLAPKDMALGQIVPFEMEIKVSGSTVPENGIISFTTDFLTKTTSGDNFGYDPTYMVYCAFVDTADPGTIDPGNNAKVDNFTSTLSNPDTSNEQIQGTFNVSGLDNGDNVIVEVWVVLKNQIPAGSTGNVQTGLLSAKTASGDAISTGQQTVPLLRVKEFFTSNADVSVIKTDNPDPVTGPSPVTQEVAYLNYTLLVENHSPDTVANGINVTDTLDPNTTFVSASGAPYTNTTSTVTFNVGALSPGQNVTLFVNTTVSNTAPTQNDNSTDPEPGSTTLPAIYDVLNKVTETAITSDSNTGNNTYYQPTNVLPGLQPSSTLTLLKQISNSSTGPWSSSITVPGGSPVYYNFNITNTGNVPLSSLSINDPNVSTASITPPLPSTLDPGASYSGIVGPVTAATLAGTYPNTATANGTYAGETKTSDPSSAEYIVGGAPALTIEKTASPTTYSAAGQKITYTYNVTNTGNVNIKGPIMVTDDHINGGVPFECSATDLAVGASVQCTTEYTITQDDIENGTVTNAAFATGTYGTDTVTSNTDQATVTAEKMPALTIDKTADPKTYSAVGDVITYTYNVTNTGNVLLSGPFTVNDDKLGTLEIAGPLAPQASASGTIPYTIVQADIDAGSIKNSAFANTTYNNTEVKSNTDNETVTANQNAALTIEKTATPITYSAVGEVITYNYNVTNTGNVVVTALNVTDDKSTPVTLDKTTIQPGESVNGTATYTITQADIDAGSVTNTAYAAGKYDDNKDVQSEPDSATVTANQNAVLKIEKTATPTTYSAVGDVITYNYIVTNEGNVVVTNLAVTDDKSTPVILDKDTIAPGESVKGTASYTIKQEDIDAGSVTNLAYAAGKYNAGKDVTSNEATATVTANQNAALTIEKTATPTTYSAVGDVITYNYKVTNTGNVVVTNLVVTDDKSTPVTLEKTTLQPGESVNGTATYTIKQADIDAGSVTNTAYAAGKYDDNKDVQSEPDSATVNKVALTGQITPTGTTCDQYMSGTAADLTQALYLVDTKTNSIKSVAPGVMFYYSTITVPEAGSVEISVDQSKDNSTWPFIAAQEAKQVILYDSGCNKVAGTTVKIDGSTIMLSAKNLPAGTYVLGVKYSLSSLQGFKPVTTPYPTVKYSFKTSLNGNVISTSQDSIDIVPKK